MPGELRLMCILAHPDDESLGCGFTLARYAAEGVRTYLATATRGERGWSGPPEENPGLEKLGRIRERELLNAAITLGIRPENLKIVPVGTPGSIPAATYVTQLLGGESLIMTRLGSELISVRMLGDDPPEFPPQVGLLPDTKQVFFYGADGNWLQ